MLVFVHSSGQLLLFSENMSKLNGTLRASLMADKHDINSNLKALRGKPKQSPMSVRGKSKSSSESIAQSPSQQLNLRRSSTSQVKLL